MPAATTVHLDDEAPRAIHLVSLREGQPVVAVYVDPSSTLIGTGPQLRRLAQSILDHLAFEDGAA